MHYLRPEGIVSPQLLQVQYKDRCWQLQLIHGMLDEVRTKPSGAGRPHAHLLYHIVLYTRGDNCFSLDGTLVPCTPGTLVLCPPGFEHDFGPASPGQTRYHELTFELTRGSEALGLPFHEMLSLYAGSPVRPLPLFTRLSGRLFQEVQRLMAATVRCACGPFPLALFQAHRGLLDMFALFIEQYALMPSASQDPIEEARRQIARRFAEPVNIGELANELAISPAYLARAFKSRYGIGPLQYRQDLRLSAAARLLQSSSLSCKEIAARLGFADVQTFTKAFTRHHGTSPGRMQGIFSCRK